MPGSALTNGRLDAHLVTSGLCPTRALAQKAIKTGRVTVNGVVVLRPAEKVGAADAVVLQEADRTDDGRIAPMDLHLHVLYEDAACLVLQKPAGIAVHPGAGMLPGEQTILHGIAFLFGDRSLPFSPDSVLVHRLDKETTGCLLVAKTPEAHRALQKQFESRTVKKTYLAVVAGVPQHREALIDAPIGRSPSDRTRMAVRGAGATRAAKTAYRVRSVDAKRNIAVLECDLLTGRTHQIRVHLSSIGHPILGDPTYSTPLSRRISEELDVTDLLLHAWRLAFLSPEGPAVQCEAAIPERFHAFT